MANCWWLLLVVDDGGWWLLYVACVRERGRERELTESTVCVCVRNKTQSWQPIYLGVCVWDRERGRLDRVDSMCSKICSDDVCD